MQNRAEKPATITFDQVADLYDYYVRVDFDIPFFLQETEGYDREILELMCGTGRVSIPLLEAGRRMTCVDYSRGMLDVFAGKIARKDFPVELVEMDVTRLDLKKQYGLILLPFHSISEILSHDLQLKALQSIAAHLERGGIFILTLQNPTVRLKSADGLLRALGEFPLEGDRHLVLSSMSTYNHTKKIVSGFQAYEIFDASDKMIEKRYLKISFRPTSDKEIREMTRDLNLEIISVYGDYSYGEFDADSSDYIIYKIRRT